MPALQHVNVEAMDPLRFESVLSGGEFESLRYLITDAARGLHGRVIWNVNSTANGGGVAVVNNKISGSATITNNTGHNLPTGFAFARQMWIELVVQETGRGTIFQSGLLAHPGDDLCDDGTFGDEYPDSFWAAPAEETLARARAAFERCWSMTPREVEETK